ncbi:hypothetical protein AGMMS50229_13960 [Campylobacterota bacterium]|nr:hypothetical protein AGMMS50229_13960 [Campylobacterota bacterium]
MRKLFLGVSVCAALLLVGCGGKQPDTAATGAACKIDGVEAPKWVCIPDAGNDLIPGLGTAPRNPAGDYGFQLKQAQASGRDSISQTIETNVQNMFKSWQRSTAQGSQSATFESDFENVSRQTANLSLKGSKVVDSWQHEKSGVLYVLMGAPVDQAQQALMSSLRNETALWQQFQSQKAQEELKAEFNKEFNR